MALIIDTIPYTEPSIGTEIVERKGIGHPDTICDGVAERFSLALSRHYLERFGKILHHNVDKALLRGGASRANFGGGEVLEPIEIYLAGRAVTNAGGVAVPVEDMAIASVRDFLREHLHALDAERHVRVHCLVRPVSADLSSLFSRAGTGAPLANDTSMGVGYAPLTALESATLALERRLNDGEFLRAHPAHGEDVKVMAVRNGADVTLTVARAFIAAQVGSLDAYREETNRVRALAEAALERVGGQCSVTVNAADAKDGSSVYLTVTGTSAECGDDGEVGRGNRANGLIAPRRPMSLEALAGKNPVTHVGKLYNVLARDIAEAVVAELPDVTYAECFLVSRIGAPIDDPAVAHVRVASERPLSRVDSAAIEDLVRMHLEHIGRVTERLLTGTVQLY